MNVGVVVLQLMCLSSTFGERALGSDTRARLRSFFCILRSMRVITAISSARGGISGVVIASDNCGKKYEMFKYCVTLEMDINQRIHASVTSDKLFRR